MERRRLAREALNEIGCGRAQRRGLLEEGAHGYGNDDVRIAGVGNVYFTQAMAVTDRQAARCGLTGESRGGTADEPDGTLFRARLLYPWTTIEPTGEERYTTLAYLGPKDRDSLHLAGHHLPVTIDMGFFALIADQLARLLSFIHDFVPNWGIAIILLTLMIRLAMFPITNLSFKSMAKMRRLKPEIDRINELYADDREKKGAATMELWRKHKVNPAAGCLPMIVQLPVFWALYASLFARPLLRPAGHARRADAHPAAPEPDDDGPGAGEDDDVLHADHDHGLHALSAERAVPVHADEQRAGDRVGGGKHCITKYFNTRNHIFEIIFEII